VASALQCYTWPDGTVTQTFDAQSPPCVASWPDSAKGTGGATSRGVSATAIRVALPSNNRVVAGFKPATIAPWVKFFNSRFTLYGRQIVIVPVTASSSTPSEQHAAAVDVADLDVFASLDLTSTKGTPVPEHPYFFDDLAKRGVISVTGGGGFSSHEAYAAHHPYQWAYLPPQDTLQRAAGSMACRQLVGRPARLSAQFRTSTRSFAIITPYANGGELPVPTAGYRESLAQCGVKPRVYAMQSPTGAGNTPTFAQLSSAGVTTLLTINAGNAANTSTRNLMEEASNAGYFPEWVIPGGLGDEDESVWAGVRSAEPQGLFGLAGWNRRVDTNTSPATQAFQDAGAEPANATFYDQLQILAAGIQAAGPNLTPQTFAAGLQGLRYPNPGAGALPDFQATVGFADDHVAVDDFALVWWDSTATSKQTYEGPRNPGAFCYIGGGTRWRAGQFPKQDRFQNRDASQC
jgi:hypothetical protein